MENQQASRSDPGDKAYAKGCMWGMSGRELAQCPYDDEDLAAFWEAGWQEGREAWEKRQQHAAAS